MSSLTSLKLTKNHLKTLPTEIGSLVNLVVFKVRGTISGRVLVQIAGVLIVAKAFDGASSSSGGLVQLACFSVLDTTLDLTRGNCKKKWIQ